MKINGLLQWVKRLNKTNWLILIGVVGMVLIGLSSLLTGNQTDSQETDESTAFASTEEYALRLEKRLSRMIQGIEGAGNCKVLVTIEQGTEYIYATEDKNSTEVDETSENDKRSTESKASDEQTYIMVSTKQGEQPLLLTELSPRIKGVVAVCDGGENPAVAGRVKQALVTALAIREDQICVVAKS